MAFRTREDLRRTYASLISDYTVDSVRFGSDDDFIKDLIDIGVLRIIVPILTSVKLL